MTQQTFTTVTHSPEETHALGERIGAQLKAGDVVCLRGELGAGKTALCRGICAGLDVPDDDFSSPTFAIVNEYHCREPIFHFDFYRLAGAEELRRIGWDDYLQRGAVMLIEWPDLAEEALPRQRLDITLEQDDDNPNDRTITVYANHDHHTLTALSGA